MSNTIPVWLVDQRGVYLHGSTANQLADGSYNVPWNAMLTAPPTAPTGEVAVGNIATQAWSTMVQNQSEVLYRTDTAEQYSLGSTIVVNGAATVYNGLGAQPAWLTNEAPPAPGSTWTNGAWVAPAVSGTTGSTPAST